MVAVEANRACMQVPSEIHTNQTRTAGMCVSVFSIFIASFLVGQCFNQMLCSMEYAVFYFFAGWMVLMTAYVAVFLPETKGLGVENVMIAWDTCVFSPACLSVPYNPVKANSPAAVRLPAQQSAISSIKTVSCENRIHLSISYC